MAIPRNALAAVAFIMFGLFNGHWKVVCFLLVSAVLMVANIVWNQESMLYATESIPLDHPMAQQTPRTCGLDFEDIYMETSDGVRLHAWFIPASDRWQLKCEEYVVILHKDHDTSLGLNFTYEEATQAKSSHPLQLLIIAEILENGLVAEWNRSQAGTGRVQKGDCIVEVNGLKGGAPELVEEIEKASDIRMTVSRLYEQSRPTLLFLHENAGNINLRMPYFKMLDERLGVNILALDYRGYGRSEGKPSEQGLIEDALTAWHWIQSACERGRVDRQKIFVLGRSLGGAVAVALVEELQKLQSGVPRGLILENTFTSIGVLAAELFPFLAPFLKMESVKRNLLRIRWETLDRIKGISRPILFVAGGKDTLIPPAHMDTLRKAAINAPFGKVVTIAEGTHNDTWMIGGEQYWQAQDSFIDYCTLRSESRT